MTLRNSVLALVAVACAASLGACKGSPSIALPPPPPQRFFFADLTNQSLSAYALPLGPLSTPGATTTGLVHPIGVAADVAGNLYVASPNEILVFAPSFST